jgi:hypothetical protein
MNSRRMRWVEHVLCIGKRRGAYRVLVGKSEGDYLEDQDMEGRIILKMIFKKCNVEHALD